MNSSPVKQMRAHAILHLLFTFCFFSLSCEVSSATDWKESAQDFFKSIIDLNQSSTICGKTDSSGPFPQTKPKKPTSTSSENPAKQAASPIAPGLYKSESEMREYFKCYIDNPAHIHAALTVYIPLINAAAAAFEIPPTLLGCLIFRESMFDPDAVSPSNAIGLSQQLASNLDYLSNVVTLRSSQEAIRIAETAQRTPAEQVEARNNLIRPHIAASEIAQAKTRLKNLGLARRWDAYFGNISTLGLRTGSIPRKLNTTNVKLDPAIAIGAGALYLREILITFNSAWESQAQLDQPGMISDPNLMLAAAGAYNMGPGGEQKLKGKVVQVGAYRYIKPVLRQNPKAWVQALTESNQETAAHITSIQNCVRPTKFENAWAPPTGTHARDCANPVNGKYQTLPGGPAKLPIEVQKALSRNNAPTRAATASTSRAPKKSTKPVKSAKQGGK